MVKKYFVLSVLSMCVLLLSACADNAKVNDSVNESVSDSSQEGTADKDGADNPGGNDSANDGNDSTDSSNDGNDNSNDGADSSNDGNDSTDNSNDGTNDNSASDAPDLSSPAENAGNIVQESSIGYSMVFDPAVFTLYDTEESDSFNYNTSETLDAPVYLSVQAYKDMNAAALAEGLALQSGIDDVTPQDTGFGKDSIPAKSIYLEKEVNGILQTQYFYTVDTAEGSLLIEVGGYVGMPETAEAKLQEMLDSFALTTE